jgi:D-3-phosphoglycerate dehydrogenase / 2-oxoglutarate reductase
MRMVGSIADGIEHDSGSAVSGNRGEYAPRHDRPQEGPVTEAKPLCILATAPLRGPGLVALRELGEVVLDPWITTPAAPLRIYGEDQLAERIRETHADMVICEADSCKGAVLELPLRAIGSTRGDPTNVDVPGATARNIPVLHAPGRNADGVAELAVALLLAVTRRLLPADRDVRGGEVFHDGTIPYQRFRAWEVTGRTVGIVGLGAVGRAARWRFEGLGMRVISFDPYNVEATHPTLESLLDEADVISVHAPPTAETLAMFGTAQFERMREGGVYLNTARAGLHDLDALTKALESGKLGGAGLDHFEGEVLPADHPLTSMDNVVLTPHIGGATYDTETNHTRMIADDLHRLVRGERPLHCVNPEVLR